MVWFLIGFLCAGTCHAIPLPSPPFETEAACEAAGERWEHSGPRRTFLCRPAASKEPLI